MTRHEAVMAALPGTSKEIAARAGISRKVVQNVIRFMMERGEVDKKIRHYGSLGYSPVYQKRKR